MDKREYVGVNLRALKLVAKNIPVILSIEEVIRYFMSFGIRVKCQIVNTTYSTNYEGMVNDIMMYCPSKFTKDNLRDSSHNINGQYLQFHDPFNAPYKTDKQFVLEATLTKCSQSFNSSKMI